MKRRTRETIQPICDAARAEGRTRLGEPEGLAVARGIGLGVPVMHELRSAAEAPMLDLAAFPGDSVMLKVVSAGLAHKSDVGGVRRVEKRIEAVARALGEMSDGFGDGEISGFLVEELVEHDPGLGGELLAGVRWTDAFGPLVVLGAGGLDAEPLAASGLAPLMLTPGIGRAELEGLLRSHPLPSLLVSARRGRPPSWPPTMLADLVFRLLDLAATCCPDPLAEIELNPIVRTARGPVALDAAARLGGPASWDPPRPLDSIDRLLHPRSVALVGVSRRDNPGRRVLANLLAAGYPPGRIHIVKPDCTELLGCACVPSLGELPAPVDLLVLAVAAADAADLVEAAIDGRRAGSFVLLAGGLGETEGSEVHVERIRARIARSRAEPGGGPVVNGGNCLGVRSLPGRCDTLFIPPHKLRFPAGPPDPVALVSQSGAFAIARTSWQPRLNPRELITVGNQIDLTVGDYLEHLAGDDELLLFGVYVEGFRPGDGARFLRAAERIVGSGRSIVLYLAGRTEAGAAASASHTAAVAGDRRVAVELARRSGVLVADSLEEFDDLLLLGSRLARRPATGRRLGALSNAGFECVAIADSIGSLELADLAPETRSRLRDLLRLERLEGIVSVRNPLDLTPIAGDETFAEAARALLADPGVDLGVIGCVPLTGALSTLPSGSGHDEDLDREEAVAARLGRLWRETTRPWVAVVDAGPLYDPLADRLDAAGIPVFRRADRALIRLGAWATRT